MHICGTLFCGSSGTLFRGVLHSPTSSVCFSEDFGNSVDGYPEYDTNNYANDLQVTSEAVDFAIQNYNSPPNGAVPEFLVTFARVSHSLVKDQVWNIVENRYDYRVTLRINGVYGAPYTYCL